MDTPGNTDVGGIGLAKELLQVILGLEPETLDRIMRLIRGSEDASDIKTMNLRKRIGPRAMRYLRNAIDIARNEGDESHDTDQATDRTKKADIEPGHRHERMPTDGEDEVKEHFTLKSFLAELNFDVDLNDPQSAVMKIKQAARMGTDRAAAMNVKDTRDDMTDAREQDAASPTKSVDVRVANLRAQLAQLEKRRAQMAPKDGEM